MDPLVRNNVTVSGNNGADDTLVFVCGLGTDQSVWNKIVPAFQDSHRIVLFDHVGAIPQNRDLFLAHQSRYLNISGYARDLLEVCEALQLPRSTVLVGHSLGALASMVASVQKPEQFSGLVLLGASPRYVDCDGYRGGFAKADVDAVYDALMNDYDVWTRHFSALAMGNPNRPELAIKFSETMRHTPKEMMLTMLCSALQTDQRDKLSQIVQPTLVIQSADDIFVPLHVAEYLRDHIGNCELRVIAASGHLPHVSAPEAVTAALKSFLERRIHRVGVVAA